MRLIEETNYKVKVKDIAQRKRIIKDNLKKKVGHREPLKIKGKWKALPIIMMNIDTPIYHLNNGRTRAAQRSYIINEEEKPDYFKDKQENDKQQNIQHEILFKLSQSPTANVHKDFLKLTTSFREDRPILLDSSAVIINGNRRLAAIREIYTSDHAKYAKYKQLPCSIIEEHLDQKNIKEIENNIQVIKENKAEYDWISLCLEIKDEVDNLGLSFKQIAETMGRDVKEIELHYNLVKKVDRCLEKDHGRPGDYDRIQKQWQIWFETEKAHAASKTNWEKKYILTIARKTSLNARDLGDRAYQPMKVLQKKANRKEAVKWYFDKHNIKPKKSDSKNKSIIDEAPDNEEISIDMIDRIPVKKNDPDSITVLAEVLGEIKDNNAALRKSASILSMSQGLGLMKMLKHQKTLIKSNLKKATQHLNRIIDKLDNK